MLLDFSKYEYPEQYCQPETEFDKEVLEWIKKWREQDAFTITTSGSTGTPKAITHSKKAMQHSAELTGNYFHFQKGQTALLCLPINKIGGVMMLVRAIIWRLKLYTLPPKTLLNFSRLPSIDFAPLLPIQALQNFENLHKISVVLLGGASISESLFLQIQKHSSLFFHSYGMTETISHIAICNLQKGQNLYEVLPSIEICTNAENCLTITALKLGVKNLQTNDIVAILSEKTFRFIGRSDTIINSGGLKIVAENIEQQLAPYIAQPFYIAGTPDTILGEKVTLFIEGKNWSEEEVADLKKCFDCISPKQAIPRRIIFKEEFNYTDTGKIIK
ncbi:MAG: AMP-binding protein [Flavobacteriaceae bacterium]|nr:AMP-binding protein [Flavobacteriaceae bacterium]